MKITPWIEMNRVIGLLCWIKSWKWNPNKKMTPWYLSELNNQRKKIRRWYRNELNHQFHYWIKKKKRRNPRKKTNGIFIFLYWIKYWERKSVHDIEWSEMKKKKTKRGESKKEPGAGSERDETMVVMKPQIFWLGMPWRWWSGLKAFASGRSKLGILETSK